jgi:hypothetical protein
MSDKRWKAVERGVAEEFNHILSDVGRFTPVERIPLLGREGPDLTVNETGLVINVKSRQSIHPRLIPDAFQLLFCGDLVIFRLSDLASFHSFLAKPVPAARSQTLQNWYDRMDKWTQEFQPTGIPAIFLHRPRMPYGRCGVAIHYDHIRRLSCNLNP